MKENAIVSILLVVVVVAIIGFLGVGVIMVLDEDFSLVESKATAVATSPPFIIRTPANGLDQDLDSNNQFNPNEGISSGATLGVGEIGDTLEELFGAINDHNGNLSSTNQSNFELPINGAMGFVSKEVKLYETKDLKGNAKDSLFAGQPFIIKSEIDNVWEIETGRGIKGYISNKNCFINLPDIIPSIIYNISNSDSSLFVSVGKTIPDVTGEKLFDYYMYSERYGTEEYIVPVLYKMAKKIYAAQKLALSEGNTLVIYEAYRPYDTQQLVAKQLKALCEVDKEVKTAVSTPPWELTWFISTGISNHQRGCAIDVSLARVDEAKIKPCGNANYVKVTKYTEYEMQSRMHELSIISVSMVKPVSSNSKEAWKNVQMSDFMTAASIRLREYCTSVGMSPLASEWWHFNDLDAKNELGMNYRLDYNFAVNLMKPVE